MARPSIAARTAALVLLVPLAASAGAPARAADGAAAPASGPPAAEATARGAAQALPAPDLEALGIPVYPGMRYVQGGLAPATADSRAPAADPVPRGILQYVSPDAYEKVVAFYTERLGPSPARVRPKDLASEHRGREIPAGASGRRTLFRSRPLAETQPSGLDPATATGPELQRALLERTFGRWNVLVSDYFLDPTDGSVRAATSIHVLAVH